MEVTEVRVQITDERDRQEKLRGFATVTLDNSFVVRDIKIISGDQGLFIAMPSRKASEHCRECGAKNPLMSNYCNDCGKPLPESKQLPRRKLYVDVAHPVNAECRMMLHAAVIKKYEEVAQKKPEQKNTGTADSLSKDEETTQDDNAADANLHESGIENKKELADQTGGNDESDSSEKGHGIFS